MSDLIPYTAAPLRWTFSEEQFNGFIKDVSKFGDVFLACGSNKLNTRRLFPVLNQGRLVDDHFASVGRNIPKRYAKNVAAWIEYQEAAAGYAQSLIRDIRAAGQEGSYKASLTLLSAHVPDSYGESNYRAGHLSSRLEVEG